jgi:hypothetical protein
LIIYALPEAEMYENYRVDTDSVVGAKKTGTVLPLPTRENSCSGRWWSKQPI